MHDSQGFLFVGGIVPFMGVHLARDKGHWLGSISLILREDSPDGEVGGISGDREWVCWVRDAQHRCRGHAGFELVECFLGLGHPGEGGVVRTRSHIWVLLFLVCFYYLNICRLWESNPQP